MKVCPCCDGALSQPGWGDLALRLCSVCGSAYLPAKASKSVEDYGKAYFTGTGPGGVDYAASRRQFRLTNQGRLARMQRYAPKGGKLFELGCALGYFLEDAEAYGWQGYGIELSGFAAGIARKRYGLRVLKGTLAQLPRAWKGFQGAAAFHVLEHLDDPLGSLRQVAGMLEPGALLTLELPDFSSGPARRQRAGWQYYLPGEHLGYYTRAGLEHLLDRAGFELLEFKGTSYPRLLSGVNKLGLTRVRELVLRNLRWLAWVKRLALALRGALGSHDCVLVLARKKAAVGAPASSDGTYTHFTPLREYLRLYRFHVKGNAAFAKGAAQEAKTLAAELQRRLKRPLKGLRILEIGCGQRAQGTLALHSLGAQVVGIDLEPVGRGWRKYLGILRMGSLSRLLKTVARELLFDRAYYQALGAALGVPLRFEGLRLQQASATQLPFSDGSFDAVVSRAVFEHLPDVPAAVAEINRVLAPGGLARVLVHLHPSLSGGHQMDWQDPGPQTQSPVPAWDHVLGNTQPAPVYLNGLRKADYLRAFRARMRVLKSWSSQEGKEHLTPAILAAAKRKGYSRQDLLERELGVLASPKKAR